MAGGGDRNCGGALFLLVALELPCTRKALNPRVSRCVLHLGTHYPFGVVQCLQPCPSLGTISKTCLFCTECDLASSLVALPYPLPQSALVFDRLPSRGAELCESELCVCIL